MPDHDLADRVRQALGALPVTEKKMFGGVCFMLDGNMLLGASKRGLMLRVGKAGYEAALAQPHARPMRQSTRVMPGFVIIAPEGIEQDDDLRRWLHTALAFVSTLPPK